MTCKRCKQAPKNKRLPRGLCTKCVVETTQQGRYEAWADALIPPEFVGDKRRNDNGYVEIKTTAGWKLEHTEVMEQDIGRRLVKGENVHHKNGVRHDNRIENLELWWRPQPSGQRVPDLISYMAEFHASAVAEAARRFQPDD